MISGGRHRQQRAGRHVASRRRRHSNRSAVDRTQESGPGCCRAGFDVLRRGPTLHGDSYFWRMRRPLLRSSAPIAMTVAKMIAPSNVIILTFLSYATRPGIRRGVGAGRRPSGVSTAGRVRVLRDRRVTTDRMRRSRRPTIVGAPLLDLADDRNYEHRATTAIPRPRLKVSAALTLLLLPLARRRDDRYFSAFTAGLQTGRRHQLDLPGGCLRPYAEDCRTLRELGEVAPMSDQRFILWAPHRSRRPEQ